MGVTDAKYESLVRVTLGKTRFSEFGDDVADDFAGPHLSILVGARTYTYSEFQSFGNPGHYQNYVFTASVVVWQAPVGELVATQEEVLGDQFDESEWPRDTDNRDWADLKVTREFRRETVVTTYTVVSSELSLAGYPSTYGPHGDEVRTLPT